MSGPNYRLQMRAIQSQIDSARRRGDQRAVAVLAPKLAEATRLAALSGDAISAECSGHEQQIAALSAEVARLRTRVLHLEKIEALAQRHIPAMLERAVS